MRHFFKKKKPLNDVGFTGFFYLVFIFLAARFRSRNLILKDWMGFLFVCFFFTEFYWVLRVFCRDIEVRLSVPRFAALVPSGSIGFLPAGTVCCGPDGALWRSSKPANTTIALQF